MHQAADTREIPAQGWTVPTSTTEMHWEALKRFNPPGLQHYMFMGCYSPEGHGSVYVYKHRDSRAYVHLSLDGQEWQYDRDSQSLRVLA